MGRPRSETYDPSVVGIYHCWSVCTQQEFLLAEVDENGEVRKVYVELRTALLAGIFAVDVLEYCILDNHMHHVLRNRPDIPPTWSDEEVVRRWWKLFPKRRNADGSPAEMTPQEVQMMLSTGDLVEWRKRLGDISWFMKELKQDVSTRFNAQRGKKGTFWAGRFKMTRLEDDGAVLAASVYVALNEIRAGIVDTPEESRHSSVWRRIQAWRERSGRAWKETAGDRRLREELLAEAAETGELADAEELAADQRVASDAWLSPVAEEGEPGNLTAPLFRASDKGYLPMSVEKYLEVLDWTGRQQRLDKPGAIPDSLPPILVRLGVKPEVWLETVEELGSLNFVPPVLAAPQTLAKLIAEAKRQWFKGIDFCRRAFE